ncbi:MAG TPA: hypothetical protein VFE34_13990 [Dongiaceae bacterium]|jgi:hypothetical protein|nr:hypothetical protein [Dongiaceae bacterium]
MLTFDDCLALSDLTEEEIAAIAEHEHLPMIVAAELGNYLIEGPDGALRVKRIILDDMVTAKRAGDRSHALTLKLVLRQFVDRHPECRNRRPAPRKVVSATVRQFLEAAQPAS